jgi:tellurite resistance protein TehA-like permease
MVIGMTIGAAVMFQRIGIFGFMAGLAIYLLMFILKFERGFIMVESR